MTSTALIPQSSDSRPASQAHAFSRPAWYAALGSAVLVGVTVLLFRLRADPVAAALLYLFVVVLVSLRAGLAPALVVSMVAIFCLDFFFTPPVFSLTVGELDVVAIVVFGSTAFVIGNLVSRLRSSFQSLQRSEAILREHASLLDLTHDTVFVRDMNDLITYWNRGGEELYGWKREEAIGRVSHQLLQTVFPGPPDEIMARLLRTGRWEGELVHTKRDRTQVTVASRWSLQRTATGEPIGTLETNNDVTERKRAEEAVRRQASLLDQTHDAILVWEFPRTIVCWNRAAEKLYGFSREQAIGRSSHDLLRTEHPVPMPMFEAALERAGE